jgi:hypothetical protein
MFFRRRRSAVAASPPPSIYPPIENIEGATVHGRPPPPVARSCPPAEPHPRSEHGAPVARSEPLSQLSAPAPHRAPSAVCVGCCEGAAVSFVFFALFQVCVSFLEALGVPCAGPLGAACAGGVIGGAQAARREAR